MSFDDIIILVKESINTRGDIFQNDEIILDSNAVDHIADDIATSLCGARDEPADVEPVVRCAECKFFNRKDATTNGMCRCEVDKLWQSAFDRPYRRFGDFCSHGAKMDGEGEPKEENKCGDCTKFEGCKEYTTEEETFPEVGGCKAFKRKETGDVDTI